MAEPDAAPRPSATLILARDAACGIEVLMLRRSPRAAFVGDAFVFPGGALDPTDRDPGLPIAGAASLDADELAHRVCAIRECFEEAGILLAVNAAGDEILDSEALVLARSGLNAGRLDIARLCVSLGLRLAVDRLACFSHWVTPPGMSRRFDTRFYVAVAPAGQTAHHDTHEAVEHAWVCPADALERHRRDDFPIVFATATTLEALRRFDSAAALVDYAAAQATVPVTRPRLAADTGGTRVIGPEHPAYAEIGRRDPAGQLVISCELLPGPVARLGERLCRITAPNGSFMTGPGTNTYLVGAGDELALIDPGPNDPRHIKAVLAAAQGRLRWILVTHTHPDHSPAAAPLKAATGAELLGMPPPEHGPQDRSFAPDRVLSDGERIELAGLVLRVIHTPGHASNHVCYLLEEERLLFTGDHIMQGSTVVIPPPDGDMAAYLASLRLLLDEDLDWLAPGHGFLMDQARARIERVLTHRLAREHKVLAALRHDTDAAIDDLLPSAYADVPAAARPVAARSLLAHLVKLRAEGRAEEHDGRWRAS